MESVNKAPCVDPITKVMQLAGIFLARSKCFLVAEQSIGLSELRLKRTDVEPRRI